MLLYLAVWTSITGETWKADNPGYFLPGHLSAESRAVALNEIRAIPECFYSRYKLPVITPNNVAMFIDLMSRFPHMKVILWTWFSGSSNLAANMAGAPFYAICLFPVDLRYGWDVPCLLIEFC